ncbi:acetyltransferase [Metabacillus endolithicus]|uniref:acetyltransferase n=1 Tax=Metabacillus endolithicus TaxID=1535204 RepID=UPI001FFAEE3E|nr:acetyltransferase [Metabacillus endolithicus]UPG64506.1 acetyltransferase [Metabacillus endolithicus]
MKIVIIGQGGHSKVINDIISLSNEHEIIGYLDDKYEDFSITNKGIRGPISAAFKAIEYNKKINFVIGIGNNKKRKEIFEYLELPLELFATLIHQSAIISPNVKIGKGTVIMANTIINSDAYIGHHSIINSGSIIEHDNRIGDFVHVSPNATLTGNVKIDKGVHIGAGTTIIPGIQVGESTIIGAGATVTKNIPANCIAVGVPAKIISSNTVKKVGV